MAEKAELTAWESIPLFVRFAIWLLAIAITLGALCSPFIIAAGGL